VATLDDVARLALELPEVTEAERRGLRTWSVGGKAFAWERPLTKADLKRLGDQAPPADPLLAVRLADLNEKEAVLALKRRGVFTISHFDGYPAVLVELPRVSDKVLGGLLVDGWLSHAPERLTAAYLAL
jgi:hypothetical protein